MNSENVAVELKLTEKPGSKLRAFADVVLAFGVDGVIRLSGFSVIQSENEAPRVMPPARKSGERYFDTVLLVGKVRSIVNQAVIADYTRAVASRRAVTTGGKSNAQRS